jgi:uncharacterized protein YheU (UPF0270 family)
MLEELASRDGTDYGEQELPLARKVVQLERLLQNRELALIYELESDSWEMVPPERLPSLGLSLEDLRAGAVLSGESDDRT